MAGPHDESSFFGSTLDAGAEFAAQVQAAFLQRGQSVGRYIVLEPIGRGGLSVLYAAFDPDLGRKVALKFLRPELSRDSTASSQPRGRLLREAQAIARVSHPNVIAVYEVGTHGEEVYIAEELVEGVDLAEWLRQERRDTQAVLDVLLQAGRGLAAAHGAGIVHRDFKPSNVLVGHDGRVRVVDFGLARADDEAPPPPGETLEWSRDREHLAASLTQTGAVIGTPLYMAPEQHLGKQADARSDQFSFCVTLFEALYGQRPFTGETRAEVAEKVMQGRPLAPPAGAAVPAWLLERIQRGLRLEPEQRYGSMRELLAALADDPRVRRRRWLLWGGLVALLVGIGVAGERYVALRVGACRGAEKHLTGIWDGERKAVLRSAIAATHVPYATAAWAGVERLVDAYARDWVAMHTEACEATRLTREQSEEILDLRMLCLGQRLDEVRALGKLLSQADEAVAEKAVQVAGALSPIADCADVKTLTAPVRPPRSRELRDRVARLRADLAEVKALTDAGKYQEALPRAEAGVAAARRLDYAPVLGEALLAQGVIANRMQRGGPAEEALGAAVSTAIAAGDERTAVEAEIELASVVGVIGRRYGEARAWIRAAQAMNQHLGAPPAGEVQVENVAGVMDWLEKNYAIARQHHARALALAEKSLGGTHLETANSLDLVGNDDQRLQRYDEALDEHRRALAIRERVLGPEHPETTESLNNLANVLNRFGRNEEALEYARRHQAILERTLGREHPYYGVGLLTTGNILGDLGRLDEALASYERALAIWEKSLGPDHPNVIAVLTCIATVRRSQGRPALARPLLERALALSQKLGGPGSLGAAGVLADLGATDLVAGNARGAKTLLEQALAIQEHRDGDPDSLASTRYQLAQALWVLGTERPRALSLAQAARDVFARPPARKKELAEVEDWLRRHAGETRPHP
ncbi:MAG TPA: serine/threonine-protein kinase [Polyangia bacterium]|nr:serine/threonine-protein kinase [Polyangia bacterium]